jgi:2-C-methyl-D-erythritol 4-phosphate cytidylyltransferase
MPDQVDQAVQQALVQLGAIDFVVNTVGLLHHEGLGSQPVQTIESLIQVNLLGAFYVAKASVAALQQTKGMLLNFSSSSYTRGRAGYTPYSASKAGIVNMTQGLAEEWADAGVRVNCLVPGRTDTDMRRTIAGGGTPAPVVP